MKHESLTKISKLLTASLCVLSLAACSSAAPEAESTEPPAVPSESIPVPAEAPESSEYESAVFNHAEEDDVPEGAAYKEATYILRDGERDLEYIEFFDEHDNVMRKVYNSGADTELRMIEYRNEYTADGLLASTVTVPQEGVEYKVSYDYYEDGKKRNVTSEDDGTIDTYNYNEKGDVSSIESSVIGGGDVYGTVLFEYEYDANGNAVKEVQRSPEGVVYMTIFRTFDENNNMLTEMTAYGENTEGATYVYEYDGQNRMIASHSVAISGDEMFFMEYEYEDFR